MIYTQLTMKAMRMAYAAHDGQVDKGGVPYVFHPFYLATLMRDEVTACAALLHDAVEDGGVSLAALEREFPPAVTGAVRLLTRSGGTDYMDYIRALAANPVARAVKLADLAHNSDTRRLAGSDGSDGTDRDAMEARLARYAEARRLLEAAEAAGAGAPGEEGAAREGHPEGGSGE